MLDDFSKNQMIFFQATAQLSCSYTDKCHALLETKLSLKLHYAFKTLLYTIDIKKNCQTNITKHPKCLRQLTCHTYLFVVSVQSLSCCVLSAA